MAQHNLLPRGRAPRLAVRTVGLLLLAAFIVTCSKVPITGRQQLNLIPAETINSLAGDEYSEFLATHAVSNDARDNDMVRRVGERIAGAVERFYAQQGQSDALEGYKWDFNVVEDDQVNAWAMPGGKVVVYTGLLPVAQNDAGLATVLGHEIAHAVARHGNERMSQTLLAQLGGMALEQALKEKPAETRSLFMTAFGVGAQVGVLLPFSRLHESEADRLGMIFMAMAGYDPAATIDFWERMSASKSGGAPIEFLSTHPTDETRIRNLEKWLPEARQYYQAR